MTLKLERDRWYHTRDGRKVRVVCVDAPGDLPVVGLLGDTAEIVQYTADGCEYGDTSPSTRDLVAKVRQPREWTLETYEGYVVATGPDLGSEKVRVREVLDEEGAP